jgi:plasmid stabilization system protein ParE
VTYRLRVTARAVADADEAYAWIAEHLSPVQAERWYQGLFKQTETLTQQPLRRPLAAESDQLPEELRELLYGKRKNKYRIIFAIRDDDVVVLYVHHAARKELEPRRLPTSPNSRF